VGRLVESILPMKILAVSGSLQAGSSNTALLRLAQSVTPEGVEVLLYASLADLPYFNPDLDGDPAPAPVADLRGQMLAADGVLLASPEYAHGMPGALKNALDWLVGSGELYSKPVAVLSASPRPTGGVYAREALERTLRAQGATVILSATVQVPPKEASTGQMPDPQAVQAVAWALSALMASHELRGQTP